MENNSLWLEAAEKWTMWLEAQKFANAYYGMSFASNRSDYALSSVVRVDFAGLYASKVAGVFFILADVWVNEYNPRQGGSTYLPVRWEGNEFVENDWPEGGVQEKLPLFVGFADASFDAGWYTRGFRVWDSVLGQWVGYEYDDINGVVSSRDQISLNDGPVIGYGKWIYFRGRSRAGFLVC